LQNFATITIDNKNQQIVITGKGKKSTKWYFIINL
jgi:hypothetical protein